MRVLRISPSASTNQPPIGDRPDHKDGERLCSGGGSAPTSSDMAQLTPTEQSRQNSKQPMRPKEYDGKETINSFLAHFQVCAEFNRWSEEEKKSWLQWSLKDRARQALWDEPNGTSMSYAQLVNALKQRFGSEHQQEIYRIELENRIRGRTESLSDLMQDVRRLMVLGYGAEQSSMWESTAIKAFLSAINDPHLAFEVKKQAPTTLDAAYGSALLLEGYMKSSCGSNEGDRNRRRDQARSARVDDEISQREKDVQKALFDTQKIVQQLQHSQQCVQQQIQALKESDRDSVPASAAHSGAFTTGRGEERQWVPRWNNRPPASQGQRRCFKCNELGHIARSCPTIGSTNQQASAPLSQPSQGGGVTQSCRVSPVNTAYLPVRIGNHDRWCLMDSGSEVSILPSRFITAEEVLPNCQELRAANGTSIEIAGEAVVELQLDTNFVIKSRFLVSHYVDEIMLGLDWLVNNQCAWKFGSRTINIGGREFSVFGANPTWRIRRVVLQEETIIPPFTQQTVKARTVYARLSPQVGNWVTESTEIQPGIRVARTLVKDTANDVLLPVLNSSASEVKLTVGTPLAPLEEVELATSEGTVAKDGETAHVEPLWNAVHETVSSSERQQLQSLLCKYSSVFSKGEGDLGRATAVMHRIDTGSSKPFRQTLRRQPICLQTEIDQQLRQMEEQGVIYPSQSEWASNIVVVKKKDGSLRCCVDYRQLNERTVKDAYPLPRIDDCLDTLAGSQIFSTFDLRSGYYQVAMDPKDAHKTTFVTRRGTYAFRVMPFGLCNAPATFQRLMDVTMMGLNFEICLVYLDDIIVFSKDVQTHLVRLELLFRRLQEANLKLKPSKCSLLQKSVEFLGYVVSGSGISTCSQKIETVQTWPVPTKLREVRGFLGLCGYYRRFVQNFSQVAAPLHALTKKAQVFVWSQGCQSAFDELKLLLTTSPILALPRDDCQYIVDTDASDHGIGAVLSQMQEGEERVIVYASRLYSDAEKRYCVTRKELLAVVHFLKQFSQYLLGNHFLVRTDHAALQWLRRTPQPIGQQGRWLEILEEFNFTVQHRPGRLHVNADAMSRRPCRQCGLCGDHSTEDVAHVAAVGAVASRVDGPNIMEYSLESVKSEQQNDVELRTFFDLKVTCEDPPAADTLASYSPTVKALVTMWPFIEIHDGIIYRRKPGINVDGSTLQVILPASLRDTFLEHVHGGFGGGHLGTRRTMEAVQRRAYWVGWGADVRRFCKSCDGCARYHRGVAPRHGSLQDMRTGGPWERVGIDITGPHPKSSKGYIYILTIIDYFSKWADAFPIRNQEASTVAKTLVDRVFSYFGAPVQILTDQGSNFQSRLFAELMKRFEIDHVRTSPYKPSTNGLIERFHRTLNAILGKVVSRSQRDWDEWIPYAVAAYRATAHESTGFSPNYVIFGRENRLPIDLVLGLPGNDDALASVDDFVAMREQRWRDCYTLVREHLQKTAERSKHRYDLRVRETQFGVGDKVWYFYPRRRVGLTPKWQRFYDGPYDVVDRLGPVTYRIQRSSRSKPIVTHADKLKMCRKPKDDDSPCDDRTRPTKATTGHSAGIVRGSTPTFSQTPDDGDTRPVRRRCLPARYRDTSFVRRVRWPSTTVLTERVCPDVVDMFVCADCGESRALYRALREHRRKNHRPESVAGPAVSVPAARDQGRVRRRHLGGYWAIEYRYGRTACRTDGGVGVFTSRSPSAWLQGGHVP